MESHNDIRFHISVETNQPTLNALSSALQRLFPALQPQRPSASNGTTTKPKASTPPPLEERKCKWCANTFQPRTQSQLYHDQRCAALASRHRATERALENGKQHLDTAPASL